MVILWMVLARVTGFRRRRHFRHWGYYQLAQPNQFPVPLVAPPKESAFDVLKRRFVKGEISDSQYEQELDRLLKTPEGKALVN